MPLPDFLIIGFPRCGTTFLMRSLREHSNIYMPDREIGFFSNESMSLSEYQSLFPEGKFNGEKTPNYVRATRAIGKIKALMPEAKLIVCVRYPIQAIQSLYHHRVIKDGNIDPEQEPFHEIILEDKNVREVSLKNFNYPSFLLNNVFRYFPEKQLKIVVQEEMVASTGLHVRDILAFLGQPEEALSSQGQITHDENLQYPSIDYASPGYKLALGRMLEYYHPVIEELYGILGRRISAWEKSEEHYRKLLDYLP